MNNNHLKRFYEDYDEDGRLLNPWGRVEYETTMHYIKRYLKPKDKVLEVGAATGRYSVTLAAEGVDVTAVELLEHNLEILRKKITPDMTIRALQGNAMDLSGLSDETFDLTLLLGPMYHLYTDADKKQAISEALRVTKRGGVVIAAYTIAEATIIEYVFKRGLLWELMEKNMLEPETFVTHKDPSGLFELVRKKDIDALMEEFPMERLHYVAADGAANFMRAELSAMDEETFGMFLKYHLTVCENPDLVGATSHSLDIFRKI